MTDAAGRAWREEIPDAAAMERLGERIGRLAPAGTVVLLEGALGTGKTTFARGVARGCGVTGPVASPTYNLILHYEGQRLFVHADLYRLESADDLASIDVAEILDTEGVACVEWPALIADRVRPPRVIARLTIDRDDTRCVDLILAGTRLEEALRGPVSGDASRR